MSGLDNTSYTVRTTAATTDTVGNQDSVVIYTATSAKTVFLPSVFVTQPGREYVLINTAAGTLTVDGFGSENINGSNTLVVVAGTPAGAGRVRLISDGTQWWTIAVQ